MIYLILRPVSLLVADSGALKGSCTATPRVWSPECPN